MKIQLLITLLLFGFNPLWAADPFWLEGKTETEYDITVYRSASCGCCKGWITHLEEHNFNVKDVVVSDVNQYKKQMAIPPQAASCHTALVNGVAIEGHVPAQDIKHLLEEKSDIRLLTVPAMPSGTPGMDIAGSPKQSFKVYSIDKDNQIGIYNEYTDY